MIEDSGMNKSGNATRGAKQDGEAKTQLKLRQEIRSRIEEMELYKSLGLDYEDMRGV